MFFKILLVALAITPNVCSGYEASADYNCISSCAGKQDGYYPLCGGNCNRYALCSYGELTEKFCPSAVNSYGNEQLTQWDNSEFLKQCVETSSTCPQVPIGKCIVSCEGVPDGNYQSCGSCNEYVSCVSEILYNMPCAPATPPLQWDDSVKKCEYTSNTCPPGRCVFDCEYQPDGNYQSCEGCDGYVSCSGGHLTKMPCSGSLVWDDDSKNCEFTSTTCTTMPQK